MAIEKLGTSEKILAIAKNAEDFSKMWQSIEKNNNLVKCSSCNHLLSKGFNGVHTLKHRKLACIIEGKISIVCPNCNTINKIC